MNPRYLEKRHLRLGLNKAEPPGVIAGALQILWKDFKVPRNSAWHRIVVVRTLKLCVCIERIKDSILRQFILTSGCVVELACNESMRGKRILPN